MRADVNLTHDRQTICVLRGKKLLTTIISKSPHPFARNSHTKMMKAAFVNPQLEVILKDVPIPQPQRSSPSNQI